MSSYSLNPHLNATERQLVRNPYGFTIQYIYLHEYGTKFFKHALGLTANSARSGAQIFK